MANVYEKFKEVRKHFGFNQKDFANELGISQTHVSSIENGKDNPSSSLIKLICYKFNIEEKWFTSENTAIIPDFNAYSAEGLLSKYNTMRVFFEHMLKERDGEDLSNTVEAFSYFVSLLSANELPNADKTQYLIATRKIFDDLEKLSFSSYMLKNYKSKKIDYKSLYDYKMSGDKMIEDILYNIRKMNNIYLKRFSQDIEQ